MASMLPCCPQFGYLYEQRVALVDLVLTTRHDRLRRTAWRASVGWASASIRRSRGAAARKWARDVSRRMPTAVATLPDSEPFP